MAHDVFISDSAKDKEIADAVCHRLEEAGIRCWIAPRDVQAGQAWDDAIVEALAATKIVVLVFSAAANDSRAVRNEIASALDGNKIVFPFRIENIVPSGGMQFHLSRVHWLDAMTPPLDGHIDILVANAQRQLGVEAAERPTPPRPQPGRGAAPAAAPPRNMAPLLIAAFGGVALLVAVALVGYSWLQKRETARAPQLPETVTAANQPVTPAVAAPPVAAPAPAPAPAAPAVTPTPAAPAPAAPAPALPQTAFAPPPVAPAPPSSEFIFPNSDHQAVDPAAAATLSCAQLGIARNEIYARHGHIFVRADLRAYFARLSWYRPTSPETQLSPLESDNVGVITRAETQKGCR